MYVRFHQLNLAPFANTPDPRFFFIGDDHREALAGIVRALRSGAGMVMITGEHGVGKTILRHVIQRCAGRHAAVIPVQQSPAGGEELLRAIARSLGLRLPPSADRCRVYEEIESELLARQRRRRPVLLIIDEAQSLTPQVFSEVRFLSNLEAATAKLLRIVLLGHTDLRARMQRPGLAALRQRLGLTHQLRPLSIAETGRYIAHRLHIAAAPHRPAVRFEPEAVRAVHTLTEGVPRLINTLADQALLVAFVRSTHTIDPAVIQAATRTLTIETPTDRAEPRRGAAAPRPLRRAA